MDDPEGGERLASQETLSPRVALERFFGHADFRGRQAEVIDRVLAGRHALVIMPTGGGKSLCYQIPALVLAARPTEDAAAPISIVLSPLIALMKDQVDALLARGIDATFINSSLSREEREVRYAGLAAGRVTLLYVTPERFRKPEFLEAIRGRRVVLLAVDEAHCVSEWGHDFRPDYTRLAEFRRLLGEPVTLALTATATPEVQTDIAAQLGLAAGEMAIVHEGIERPNLRLGVRDVWGDDEKLEQILDVRSRYAAGSGIVYFTLIRVLDRFSTLLRERRVPHRCYHGDLDREARRRVQEAFMQGSGELVLATNAFGMGIDKDDIRFVVHAEVPGSMEQWYQEVGRAGRDGGEAECVLLYDGRDLATQMEFIEWSNPGPDVYAQLLNLFVERREEVAAFGLPWIRDHLHAGSRHDRRLETALAMLERHGVIEGDWRDEERVRIEVVGELPPTLRDPGCLGEKLRRDRERLLSLVQFVRHDGDPGTYLRRYFLGH